MTGVLGWPTIAMERDVNPSRFDIADRRDVACLVNVFYDRVRDDDILGPIFDDIAHVDWATHLPRMYDFWESVLFARATFKGAPLVVHEDLPCAPCLYRGFVPGTRDGCRSRDCLRLISEDRVFEAARFLLSRPTAR